MDSRGFGLIEQIDQARFATRGIILFQHTFFGGFVQGANCQLDGLLCLGQVACRDQSASVFDFGARAHADHAIAGLAPNVLAHCFNARMFPAGFLGCVCQFENPPRLIRGAYYIIFLFLTSKTRW